MTDNHKGSSIEELLLADPNVEALHKFPHPAFPNIDYSMWKNPSKAKGEIVFLQEYIDAISIGDRFGSDHSARRQWRNNQTDGQIQNIIEKDSLRRRGFFHARDHISELTEGYLGTKKDELTAKYTNLLDGMPDNYRSLPTLKKLEFVNAVKQRAYDVIQFLSQQSPAS